MNRILITFGGAAYDQQTAIQHQASVDQGFIHRVYDDRWLIGTDFYRENRWIFNRQPQHGFGFCSWKPYIIQHALARCEEGDVVMYLDADTYPITDIGCLFDLAQRDGVVLFEEQGCVNKTWIKRECFEQMGAEDAKEAMIACGRFQLFKKDRWSELQWEVLHVWEHYSVDPLCQFHEGSASGDDDPSFIKNSCEQSVLSLAAWHCAIPLHRTPDQNGWPVAWDGNYKPEDTYPQLLLQVGARGNINDLSGSRFRNID